MLYRSNLGASDYDHVSCTLKHVMSFCISVISADHCNPTSPKLGVEIKWSRRKHSSCSTSCTSRLAHGNMHSVQLERKKNTVMHSCLKLKKKQSPITRNKDKIVNFHYLDIKIMFVFIMFLYGFLLFVWWFFTNKHSECKTSFAFIFNARAFVNT